MTVIMLDVDHMQEEKKAHAYLKEKLGFPDYYGNNLDALYDCLTEQQAMHIVFVDSGKRADYFRKILAVFRAAERENGDICVKIVEKSANQR